MSLARRLPISDHNQGDLFRFSLGMMMPTNPNIQSWKIQEIKTQVSKFLAQGTLDLAVVEAIRNDASFAPIECEILDYKQEIEESSHALGKLVLQVTSFYNTFGGYLIYGVREVASEVDFQIVGVGDKIPNCESLKAKLKEYTGERIQVAGCPFEVSLRTGNQLRLFVLLVPKRSEGTRPTHFVKDGPGDPSNGNRPLFRKHETYCRAGDECIEAKGPKLFELAGKRTPPYLANGHIPAFHTLASKRLRNNLPDRNSICPKFIGRVALLDQLWAWLADDLSHIKMLAGEGGLGKSSIAYEFAERLSITPESPFEQIIWLTAKKKQFMGVDDRYVDIPYTHYSTYSELLAIAVKHLPVTADDIGEEPDSESLRRGLRAGLANYPSFVVVDDIDSLAAEEQRKVAELGLLLGGTESRLLLTTRNNIALSHDTAIEIDGFTADEYPNYLQSLRERGVLQRELTAGQVMVLHGVTSGSPLFTESFCRLLRFQNFDNAKKDWVGAKGAKVRAAALEREIQLLSPEAKRVLLVIAYMGEVSVPEIGQITEYPEQDVQTAIEQLTSLFLIGAEAIADIPRFQVPENTVRLVLERSADLVTSDKEIAERVKKFRECARPTKGKDLRISHAISQAQALERSGDMVKALETIDEAIPRIRANADLLGYRAELLMRFDPAKVDDARRDAAEAFRKGCRRPGLYLAWYEAEFQAHHYVGAEEAARAALIKGCRPISDWHVRLALALVFKAEARGLSADSDSVRATLSEASAEIQQAIRAEAQVEAKKWEGALFDVHDKWWELLKANLGQLDGMETAISTLETMWDRGDHQFKIAKRAIRIAEAGCDFLENPLRERSDRAAVALGRTLKRCGQLVAKRHAMFPNDTRNADMSMAWHTVQRKFDRVTNP